MLSQIEVVWTINCLLYSLQLQQVHSVYEVGLARVEHVSAPFNQPWLYFWSDYFPNPLE